MKKDVGRIIGSVVLVLMLGAVLVGIWYITDAPYRAEPEMLKDHINKLDNVSDEYRQGWNDCVDLLMHERMKAVNVTTN